MLEEYKLEVQNMYNEYLMKTENRNMLPLRRFYK